VEAIKDFARAIDLNPELAEPYANRARVFQRLDKRIEAIKDFKTAARLGDKDAQSILDSGTIGW
jgi:tetratricopeptide (TPR) repeat protein